MSVNPMGMDVYVLTDAGEGTKVEYKKYEAIGVQTDIGIIKKPVTEGEYLGCPPEEGTYFKKLSYMLYSAGGTRFLSIAISVELAKLEELEAHKRKERGAESREEFEPFSRTSDIPKRNATREEQALAAFFSAAREAVQIDGFVDMRVYPPVARKEFTA